VAESDQSRQTLTWKTAVTGDWTQDAPGVRHKITLDDLPPPYATKSAQNGPRVVRRPVGGQLRVPPGFKIEEYASGFVYPRFLLTAPNGDIFVTESRSNTIKVLRDSDGDGKPNVSDIAMESDRARIFEFNPDGTGRNVFAWGIRNAVGIAFRPGTNDLWMSTNERDDLGEDLVPDYISRVQPGGFYGWPWFYLGNHQDPRHKGKHPEFASRVLVPDVLVQSHSATLNLCFYDGTQFPAEYRGDIFAAFHGSWNRERRTGYKIVRVPFDKSTGKARGDYEDFVTGFVTSEGNVWGRPVGITVAKDGSLLFSEDGNKTIWRMSFIGKVRLNTCHPKPRRRRGTSRRIV
jgi:glucose/arabinose dehydrogenase